ncbi:MAG: hypothetical protein IJB33_08240 [Akkermansia sp.]|nr:hypothetical protein [Akkermansia sp.]
MTSYLPAGRQAIYEFGFTNGKLGGLALKGRQSGIQGAPCWGLLFLARLRFAWSIGAMAQLRSARGRILKDEGRIPKDEVIVRRADAREPPGEPNSRASPHGEAV